MCDAAFELHHISPADLFILLSLARLLSLTLSPARFASLRFQMFSLLWEWCNQFRIHCASSSSFISSHSAIANATNTKFVHPQFLKLGRTTSFFCCKNPRFFFSSSLASSPRFAFSFSVLRPWDSCACDAQTAAFVNFIDCAGNE